MSAKEYNGRRHEIYFPSSSDLTRWKDHARKYHVSLSKFIYEIVENHLERSPRPDKISSQTEDMLNLQAELNRLKDELRDKAARLERTDTNLFNLKHQPFLDPDLKYL
jgi:hypothetical protein